MSLKPLVKIGVQRKRPDGIVCLQKNNFDLGKSLLYSEFQLVNDKGEIINKKQLTQRIYTPLELKKMLESAGFKVLVMYGSFKGDDLSFDLPQIITIAQKY